MGHKGGNTISIVLKIKFSSFIAFFELSMKVYFLCQLLVLAFLCSEFALAKPRDRKSKRKEKWEDVNDAHLEKMNNYYETNDVDQKQSQRMMEWQTKKHQEDTKYGDDHGWHDNEGNYKDNNQHNQNSKEMIVQQKQQQYQEMIEWQKQRHHQEMIEQQKQQQYQEMIEWQKQDHHQEMIEQQKQQQYQETIEWQKQQQHQNMTEQQKQKQHQEIIEQQKQQQYQETIEWQKQQQHKNMTEQQKQKQHQEIIEQQKQQQYQDMIEWQKQKHHQEMIEQQKQKHHQEMIEWQKQKHQEDDIDHGSWNEWADWNNGWDDDVGNYKHNNQNSHVDQMKEVYQEMIGNSGEEDNFWDDVVDSIEEINSYLEPKNNWIENIIEWMSLLDEDKNNSTYLTKGNSEEEYNFWDEVLDSIEEINSYFEPKDNWVENIIESMSLLNENKNNFINFTKGNSGEEYYFWNEVVNSTEEINSTGLANCTGQANSTISNNATKESVAVETLLTLKEIASLMEVEKEKPSHNDYTVESVRGLIDMIKEADGLFETSDRTWLCAVVSGRNMVDLIRKMFESDEMSLGLYEAEMNVKEEEGLHDDNMLHETGLDNESGFQNTGDETMQGGAVAKELEIEAEWWEIDEEEMEINDENVSHELQGESQNFEVASIVVEKPDWMTARKKRAISVLNNEDILEAEKEGGIGRPATMFEAKKRKKRSHEDSIVNIIPTEASPPIAQPGAKKVEQVVYRRWFFSLLGEVCKIDLIPNEFL